MGKTLLEKSRAINRGLQKMEGAPVDFFEMCQVLASNLDCSVFVVGRRGQISGYAFQPDCTCVNTAGLIDHATRFPESFNQEFMNIQETQANVNLEKSRKCIFNFQNAACDCSNRIWAITPVFGGAERIATLILMTTNGRQFTEEDIVLTEYGAVVIANEIMRMTSERIEDQTRKKAAVQIALATLSFSEKKAIGHILDRLDGSEGLLVASRIADQEGITRSIIVSALRKCESAGVIESRSLGMKGTYIKVLNNHIFKELKK